MKQKIFLFHACLMGLLLIGIVPSLFALSEECVKWKPQAGLQFDGKTKCIVVEEADAFNLPAFSVEAWVRCESNAGSQVFLNRGEANTDFTFYLFDNHIRMLVQDREGYSHANEPVPPKNTWFHCVGTFDREGNKKLYYNGVLVNQETLANKSNYKPIQSKNPLFIGALKQQLAMGLERPLKGEMDNIRIWDKALTPREIQTLLKTEPKKENIDAMKKGGLIAYWSSRAGKGNTVSDLSGNGHHGKWLAVDKGPKIVKTQRADGYHGIWYSNQRSDDRYRYKYSGGLGTYCAKHRHHAQYAPQVDKTFFVYGGTKGVNESDPLLMMISYYDHKTNTVPQPAIIQEKGTGDAHHNPTLSIDERGHLWVFASAHGGKDGFIWKSVKPYSIDQFELVMQREFTYPQPRYVKDFGFTFLFTKYTAGRECYFSTSKDGRKWTPDKKIAGFSGHYQISSQHGKKRGTAFNWHPPKIGLNFRTNLYYMQTEDFGQTWTNVEGDKLELPLNSPQNKAMVYDFQKDERLVYLKDITYDRAGNPVILVILSKGYESGPKNGPRAWIVAQWSGEAWLFKTVTESDHNYDMGSLYIEKDGTWRIIAPTAPGPQEYCTGGEVEMWVSKDQGNSWTKTARLTDNSERNHTYVRRPLNAHPGFYAFWADGNSLKPSISNLYFCNKDGSKVWQLPRDITEDRVTPTRVK